MMASGGPLFRAVTKENVPDAETKGTLTAFWNKKTQREKISDSLDEINLVEEAIGEAEPMDQDVVQVTPEAPDPIEVEPAPIEPTENVTDLREEESLEDSEPVAAAELAINPMEKKRKRISWTEAQLEALNALFESDPYPSAESKKQCAITIGIELTKVQSWFEKRRKKVRAKGQILEPKRGSLREGEAVPASTELREQQQQEETNTLEGTKDKPSKHPGAVKSSEAIVDSEPTQIDEPSPVADQPTVQAETAQQEVTACAAAAAVPETSKPLLPSLKQLAELKIPEIMDLSQEIKTLRECGPAAPLTDLSLASLAPFSDAQLATLVVGQTLPLSALVTATTPLLTATEGADAPPTHDAVRNRILEIAVRKSHDPADTSKGASDQDALEAIGEPSLPCMWQWELRDVKLLPKSLRLEATLLRRRARHVGDRLNAVVNAHRALTLLQEGKRYAPSKFAKVLETLAKAKTLEQVEAEAADARATTAAKQNKVAMSAEEKQRDADSKEAEKERLRQEREAAKEQARKAKEEERARVVAEKEAEKERKLKEKEAEKERKMKEVEASKIVKKTGFKDADSLSKTANKFKSFFKQTPAPKAGPTLHPHLQSCPPASATVPSQDQDPAASNGRNVPSNGRNVPSNGRNVPSNGRNVPAVAAAPAASAFQRRFLKPPNEHLVPQPTQPLNEELIDSALAITIPIEEVIGEWRHQLSRAAGERAAERAAPPTTIGLPPTWARAPGALEAATHQLRQLRESGVDPSAVRTWRRKFIFFRGDSNRPPYYGSWPAAGPEVRPRRYLGRDETVDYEVMSDLEWEEEPEGSSLSGADSASEGGVLPEGSDAMEDSFMVADGYLSEDEGVRLEDDLEAESVEVMMEVDAAAAGIGVGVGPGGGASILDNGQYCWTHRERKMAALQVQMDRARRVGKPLIVIRPDCLVGGTGDQTHHHPVGPPGGAAVLADPSLLEALAMEVLQPGVFIQLPTDPEIEQSAAVERSAPTTAKRSTPASGGGHMAYNGGGASAVGRPKNERPEDLIPALVGFLKANPVFAKSKLIEGFISAFPDRKMSKKWVGEKISHVAERVGNKWQVRAVPPPAPIVPAEIIVGAPDATPAAQPASTTTIAAKMCVPNVHGQAPMPTPPVPSALRGLGPASLLKAPERLVTTTDAGKNTKSPLKRSAPAPAPEPQLAALQVPETDIATTRDPWWTEVVRHIDADIEIDGVPTFSSAFELQTLSKHIAAVPASVLSVLLAALARAAEARPTSVPRLIHYLFNGVTVLAMADEAASSDLTPSQKAWGEPLAQPAVASIAELCREPDLLCTLTKCVSAGCAVDCLAVLEVLGGNTLAREALQEAKDEDKAALCAAIEGCAHMEGVQEAATKALATLFC